MKLYKNAKLINMLNKDIYNYIKYNIFYELFCIIYIF